MEEGPGLVAPIERRGEKLGSARAQDLVGSRAVRNPHAQFADDALAVWRRRIGRGRIIWSGTKGADRRIWLPAAPAGPPTMPRSRGERKCADAGNAPSFSIGVLLSRLMSPRFGQPRESMMIRARLCPLRLPRRKTEDVHGSPSFFLPRLSREYPAALQTRVSFSGLAMMRIA
jgi:hypothetical protein